MNLFFKIEIQQLVVLIWKNEKLTKGFNANMALIFFALTLRLICWLQLDLPPAGEQPHKKPMKDLVRYFTTFFLYRWQDQRERPLVKSSLSATFGDTLAANAASIAAATVGESSPRYGH